MARLTLADSHKVMRGTVDGWVYYMFYGKQCVRMYVKPHDPETPKQRKQRNAFQTATDLWSTLPDEEKEYWRERGRKRGMNGLNVFISNQLKPAGEKSPVENEYKMKKRPAASSQVKHQAASDTIPVLSPFEPASVGHRSGLERDVLRL